MNYNFDSEQISEQITVPVLRKPRLLAWLKVFTSSVQWLYNLFLDYKDGNLYSNYNVLTVYQRGDRITWADNRNYEFIYDNTTLTAGLDPSTYPQYWIVIQDNFIGTTDRSKFNSQIIMLEWQLNIWYRNALPLDQIYIGNNSNPSNFWLGASGATSSKLSKLSQNSSSYLANINTVAGTDFTVYYPSAVWATMGATTADKEKTSERFINKYKLAGITFNSTFY